jgi:antitoxin component of RelBE/YafQ-DinJ toxin-antitoxin module
MRREYDFSKGRRNPYAAKLKRSVTIRLDETTIDYFKAISAESEIPYQTLINLYLRECAATGRRLAMEWREPQKTSRARARATTDRSARGVR